MNSPGFRQSARQICRAVGYTKGAQPSPGQVHAWKQGAPSERLDTRFVLPSLLRMLWSKGSQHLSSSELRRGPGLLCASILAPTLSMRTWSEDTQGTHGAGFQSPGLDKYSQSGLGVHLGQETLAYGRILGSLVTTPWIPELLGILCVAITLFPILAQPPGSHRMPRVLATGTAIPQMAG